MKSKIVVAVLLAAMSVAVSAETVEGWGLTGARAASYEIGTDSQTTLSGNPSRFIRYVGGDDTQFGSLAQQISAKNYRGKRVRFQAMIKTRDVTKWAGLWMSANRAREDRSAVFHNTIGSPIVGTADWQLRSITLDIPEDVASLGFGVIDAGRGQVWVNQLSLEVVGKEVPIDVPFKPAKLPTEPAL